MPVPSCCRVHDWFSSCMPTIFGHDDWLEQNKLSSTAFWDLRRNNFVVHERQALEFQERVCFREVVDGWMVLLPLSHLPSHHHLCPLQDSAVGHRQIFSVADRYDICGRWTLTFSEEKLKPSQTQNPELKYLTSYCDRERTEPTNYSAIYCSNGLHLLSTYGPSC